MRVPIRTRLTVIYCAIFCVGMMALEGATYLGLRAAAETVVDRELESRFVGVVDFVDKHIARLPPARFHQEISSHGSLRPELLTILDVETGPVFESAVLHRITFPKGAPASPRIQTMQAGDRPLRVLTRRRNLHGRVYQLTLASDLTATNEVVRYFRWLLLFLAPIILACAAAVSYWVSGRALAPVSELIHAAGNIGVLSLSQRVTVHPSGDEIEQLALTLNRMLARIEASFRQVRQFTADASHELRTPLAAIRATAEVALLNTGGSADSYRQALHRVLGEAERNTILLDNLLRLARADSDAVMFSAQRIDLGTKLIRAGERVEILAKEKRILLRVIVPEVPDGTLAVGGDAEHLLRLCLILLDNAIKYTPAGGSVTAQVQRVSATVRLSVEDTGIGIAAADLPNIFERFYRADEARTSGSGSGLGLAIAKWIVESHQATIHITSSPGAGSTFQVDFPALLSGDAIKRPASHTRVPYSL